MKRPAVAIVIPGGIGTGKNNIGVPVLNGLVKIMSAQFDLTVFQLYKVNENYKAEGFELVEARRLTFPFVFNKHHKKKNFVAVHGFWAIPTGLLAVIVGKLFGVKSVVSVLGGDGVGLPEINYGRLHRPLLRWLTLLTLRNATHINALTRYLVNNLKAVGFNRPMEVIPWGVDRDMFDYHPKAIGAVVRFIHVANFHPVKDQETLLRAFEIINNRIPSELIMLGTGVDHQKVTDLIARSGLQKSVKILDPIPYEHLPAIYHGADVLLHTSLSEGQCEVVTEAMSCGLPVCGTRVGLMHDLPDCCVAVDVRDYATLAEETIKLLGDPERMNELRMRAHQWTTHHDILWTAERLMTIYRS
ncbi:MAG TPA: glycosyltransferase [Cyclobacteriaceae bacterium]|nr:glycosyltransferase [Cyclobacteriaceae bacterium]